LTTNNKELAGSVNQFLGFFSDKLTLIGNTDFKESNSLFRKILYVGLLDALSKTTTYPKKGNRERIVSFMKHFTDWKDHERISLPHLVRFLGKVPDPEFSVVREYAFSLIDQWPRGSMISLDKEPFLLDVKKLWPSTAQKPLEDINLEHLQHVNLFYRHRNSLIHELREPGYGMEFKEDTEPFYHSMSRVDSDEKTWELVYPLGFYERICRTAIDKLREYYIKERIDPYSLYNFGTYWIDELNR